MPEKVMKKNNYLSNLTVIQLEKRSQYKAKDKSVVVVISVKLYSSICIVQILCLWIKVTG